MKIEKFFDQVNKDYKLRVYSIEGPDPKHGGRIFLGNESKSELMLVASIRHAEENVKRFLSENMIQFKPILDLMKNSKSFQTLLNLESQEVLKLKITTLNEKEDNFVQTRRFLNRFRGLTAKIAANYYEKQGIKFIDKQISIIIKDEWIPSQPIQIKDLDRNLRWDNSDHFQFEKSVFYKSPLLPRSDRYSSDLNDYFKDATSLNVPRM